MDRALSGRLIIAAAALGLLLRLAFGLFYWIDKPFGYALAGELSREELQPLAQLVYRQINP